MKRVGVVTISAWLAHALAWIAGLWLVFGPVHQGVSVTPTLPGEPAGEVTGNARTLVDVNGLWALWLLFIPILLSGLTLLAIRFTYSGQARRKVLLGVAALALLAFCLVGMLSIGLLYLPTALALLVAAVAESLNGRADAEAEDSA